MDALPRSSSVVAKTIPLLVEKLRSIQCMDVAEQALSALELLSRRHGKDILQAVSTFYCYIFLNYLCITAILQLYILCLLPISVYRYSST